MHRHARVLSAALLPSVLVTTCVRAAAWPSLLLAVYCRAALDCCGDVKAVCAPCLSTPCLSTIAPAVQRGCACRWTAPRPRPLWEFCAGDAGGVTRIGPALRGRATPSNEVAARVVQRMSVHHPVAPVRQLLLLPLLRLWLGGVGVGVGCTQERRVLLAQWLEHLHPGCCNPTSVCGVVRVRSAVVCGSVVHNGGARGGALQDWIGGAGSGVRLGRANCVGRREGTRAMWLVVPGVQGRRAGVPAVPQARGQCRKRRLQVCRVAAVRESGVQLHEGQLRLLVRGLWVGDGVLRVLLLLPLCVRPASVGVQRAYAARDASSAARCPRPRALPIAGESVPFRSDVQRWRCSVMGLFFGRCACGCAGCGGAGTRGAPVGGTCCACTCDGLRLLAALCCEQCA